MPMREMYVVLLRERGLLLVEPKSGLSQGETVKSALNVDGGYSAGRVEVDIPETATEGWVAWVEGEGPNGKPYFFFRAFDSTLSEGEVESVLSEANETALRLNRSEIYHATDEKPNDDPGVIHLR
jgi:hypothetical protein